MTTKLKCILIDDELPGLAYLKMLCEQLPELEIVKTFNTSEKLLEALPGLDFDLCITDIEMPGMDGLALAGKLKGKLIIFTTAYKEYAADAFTLDAVDYITKPVAKERLQKAVGKAFELHKKGISGKRMMSWNTDKGKSLIYFNQLVYIKPSEQDSRDKEALLIDGNPIVLKNINFDKLLLQLPEADFCRINKKEIVALTAVKHYSHNEIILNHKDKSGKLITLALSDTYRADFMKKVSI